MEFDEFAKSVKTVTECFSCNKLFSDVPKLLPCKHTFCLDCLQVRARDRPPNEELPCPLCRKLFQTPAAGLQDLPTNFCIANLLGLKIDSNNNSNDAVEKSCEVCSELKENAEVATRYCIDCEQHLCSFCGNLHLKQKVARSHQLVEVGSEHHREELSKIPAEQFTYCEQHPKESLAMFCVDCETTICKRCFEDGHKSHICFVVDELKGELQQKLDAILQEATVEISSQRLQEKQHHSDREDFVAHVLDVKDQIIRSGTNLKFLIDRHTDTLIQELSTIKEEKLTVADMETQKLRDHLAKYESFRRFCDEAKNKEDLLFGVTCELQASLSELQNPDVGDYTLSSNDVTFRATELEDLLADGRTNLVGMFPTKNQNADVHVCPRFAAIDTVNGWSYDGQADAITFVTNKNIELVGISFYGGFKPAYHEINLKIFEGTDELCGYRMMISGVPLNSDGRTAPIPVTLPDKILLKAGSPCTIESTITGPTTYCGELGKEVCRAGGVNFQFQKSHRSTNDTDTDCGQIPEIIFAIPNSDNFVNN